MCKNSLLKGECVKIKSKCVKILLLKAKCVKKIPRKKVSSKF